MHFYVSHISSTEKSLQSLRITLFLAESLYYKTRKVKQKPDCQPESVIIEQYPIP